MAANKALLEKMSDEGLTSYIVTTVDKNGFEEHFHFWAEDYGHAGEQADDMLGIDSESNISLVETTDEYEARTGMEYHNR